MLALCAVALGGRIASLRYSTDPQSWHSLGAILAQASHALSAGVEPSNETVRPTTTVKQLSCERLPGVPGKAVTTALVTFPPRALSPPHRHPGAVTAYVIKGSIRSQLEGSPAQTYPAGSTWFEPPRILHVLAENESPIETAELLAVFVADEDCGPLTIPEPSSPKR